MFRLRMAVLVMLTCATGVALPVRAATAPSVGVPWDAWYEVTLDGSPAGFVHETVTLDGDGNIATNVVSDYTVRWGDDMTSVQGTDVWKETPEDKPLSCTVTRNLVTSTNRPVHVLEVTVDKDRLKLRSSDGGDVSFSSIVLKGALLFPRGVERLHASKGFVPGSSYTYTTFDPDLEAVSTVSVAVGGPEKLEVMGEVRQLHKLVVRSDLHEGVDFVEWRDDDGRLWREDAPSLGISRQRATSDVQTQEREAVALLEATLIRSNAVIPSPQDVDEAVYELTLEGGDISDWIIEDGRQHVVGKTDGGVKLEVQRVVPAPGTTLKLPIRNSSLKEYLDGNPMMQNWELIMLATSARAVWGANEDSWVGTQQQEAWVHENIKDRGTGPSFASARQVLDDQAGDFFERAIVLATMARNVKVPSKLVGGLVYRDGSFVYHVWVEVWTGDGWYALDPSVGEGSVDATHIKLVESAVPGGRTAELSVGITKLVSGLGVKVLNYTEHGKTTVVSSG